MSSRRIFGIIFLLLASFFTLATIGLTTTILKDLLGSIKIFTSNTDAEQIGEQIGHIIYWMLHFAILTTLWIYGGRWVRNPTEA